MDRKTLASFDEKQLQKELQDRLAQRMDFRFQLSSHQLSRVRDVRKVRKEIAQIKTFLRKNTLSS